MSDNIFENDNTKELDNSEINAENEALTAPEDVSETAEAAANEAAEEIKAVEPAAEPKEKEPEKKPKKTISSTGKSGTGKKKSTGSKSSSGKKSTSGKKPAGKTTGKKSTKKKKKKKKKVTFQRSQEEIRNQTRKTLEACAFMLPWFIGLAVFFAYPILNSLRLSFSQITKVAGWQMEWIGISNYVDIFKDVSFTSTLVQAIEQIVIYVPSVVILSMILAVLLNGKLVCRGVLRSIFFLPVLLGTGYIIQQLLGMQVDADAASAGYEAFSSNMDRGITMPYELEAFIPEQFVTIIEAIFAEITQILWRSGVQILIFLSGLQAVTPAIYESARVDGATEWEMFWKITIPSLAPVTVLSIIYTIVDTATSDSNAMISLITNQGDASANMATAAAMSWIYLFVVLAFVGVVLFFTRNQHSTAEQ